MKTIVKTITITLEGTPTKANQTTVIESVKKLLAEIWPQHNISYGFTLDPKEITQNTATPSSIKLNHRFSKIAGKKILVIKASGLVRPSEDSGQWEKIERYLEGLVDGAQAVMVHLENVPYVDSVGLGFFVTFHTFLTTRGIKLIFVSPTERVSQKLKICRLDTVFNIVDDKKQARDEIKKN